MTELSLLTQGDWAERTAEHNGGTRAAPLVLMGDTCYRIGGEDTGGGVADHMGRWYTRSTHPQKPFPVVSHSIKTCTKPGVCCGETAASPPCLSFLTKKKQWDGTTFMSWRNMLSLKRFQSYSNEMPAYLFGEFVTIHRDNSSNVGLGQGTNFNCSYTFHL